MNFHVKNLRFCVILFVIIVVIYIILMRQQVTIENFTTSNIVYVFWTGGYDSTFRICQALIDEGRTVQPIYISDIIDNLPQNSTRRMNKKFEYSAMNKIREILNRRYPFTKRTLLQLMDIKKVDIDNDIAHHMRVLKSQGRVRRAVCQYGAMAQVTRNLEKNIEICVENEPGSMLNRTMSGKLDRHGRIKKNLKRGDESIHIFDRFIFSTIKLSKHDMLKIAKRNGYDNILRTTWSCWYPVNGKPCGRCIMCRERVV